MADGAGSSPISAQVLEFITGEAEGRACKAIPDEACTNVPRNFLLNVSNGASTKLAEQLASPGLVLPWLLAAIGAPPVIAGWLLPIKQGGSMAPQLFVSGAIRGVARRKWVWAVAGLTQAVALAAMIPAVLWLDPVLAGWAVAALMAVFAVASGSGSVAFSDVVGKTIPKQRRGRLLGLRSAIGGLLTISAGILLKLWLGEDSSVTPYLGLIAVAAVLWALAALLFGSIEETRGATEGGRNLVQEAGQGWHWAKELPGFRRFLATRMVLLLSVELALPFYALHARSVIDGTIASLGLFVLVSGISAAVSSSIWGRYSDLSSRKVLIIAGGIGGLAGVAALSFTLLPETWQTAWAYTPVFFIHGLALAGVRLGRKTYLVDAAPADERPTYVAFSNSVIGVFTLLGGALGWVGQSAGWNWQMGLLVVLAALGILTAWRTPEADDMVPER